MRHVLSVTSEMVPFIKTGGLADVAGALPGALKEHGWQMRTLLPAYRALKPDSRGRKVLWSDPDLFGGPAQVVAAKKDGAEVLLLDAPHLYDRDGGPYGDPRDFRDNPQRFAALGWAAAHIAHEGLADGWRPEVLHAHDWQAGLAPAYLRYAGSGVKTVITIHNIAFQGLAPAAMLGSLRLPIEEFHREGLEYWGHVSTLKAGLVTADAITTVSPTYAAELMRGEFGMGLEGVIARRSGDLHGILNGVDETVWDPAADPLVKPYSAKALAKKAANRTALLAEFGLDDSGGPLAIVVSRLTGQKGIDLLVEALPAYMAAGGMLAVLGSGDPALENALKDAVRAHPGRVGVRIGYDEPLSHRMFAGGDAVLVPSRFEPCGLTQLYGLRYGTVPVVAATGGLADTVIDANPVAVNDRVATGIQFHPVDAQALRRALGRLVQLYHDTDIWRSMQKRGMTQPLGWAKSSAEYAKLYESLTA